MIGRRMATFLFIYLLIILGYVFSYGFFFLPGLSFLILALILMFYLFIKKNFTLFNSETGNFIKLVMVIMVVLSMALYGGLYQDSSHWSFQLGKALTMISILLTLLYLVDSSKLLPLISKYKFVLLLVIALSLRILLVYFSPDPYIDVFEIQKTGPKALLLGENPYSVVYQKLYANIEPTAFTYGPAVLFLDLPAVLLTNDPRYTFIFAELLTSLLFYTLLKKTKNSQKLSQLKIAEILPIIYLYNPRGLFVIEQAWIDPLLIFLLTLFVFCFFYLRKKIIALVILGVALATKQYVILLLPFLLKTLRIRPVLWIVPAITAALLVLPFFLLSPSDFIHDTVLYNVIITSRHDALSINSLVYNLFRIDIPPILFFGANILILLLMIRKNKINSASDAFFAAATFSLLVFLTYKIAFIDYFYFAGSLVLIATVLLMCQAADYQNGKPT